MELIHIPENSGYPTKRAGSSFINIEKNKFVMLGIIKNFY